MEFSKSWLIRIGSVLVFCTAALVFCLSLAGFATHLRGPMESIALLAFFWGSVGMLLICVGAIFVLIHRRTLD